MENDPIAEKLRATKPNGYPGDFNLIEPSRVIKAVDMDIYYNNLSNESQLLVDKWIEKYQLMRYLEGMATGVYLVDNHPDWVIEVWGIIGHRHFTSPESTGKEFPLFYDREAKPSETIIATFAFNDFPWEVLD